MFPSISDDLVCGELDDGDSVVSGDGTVATADAGAGSGIDDSVDSFPSIDKELSLDT